ncbi:Planctomycete cytochrome C [Rosistilla carotiformis]|uniref:Planctomycete cytochrome C n=1 Tax=Rosistilla carotiformis TaxID=2528017 RepID=A0A518JMG3_9BACT|nr:c-type cytochrome domain-containing protein [Rosistilla carotiformis]QDV66677.1 Planctomycete cytochrome C [Rosistilla carotiformis]
MSIFQRIAIVMLLASGSLTIAQPAWAVITRAQRIELTQVGGIIKNAGENYLQGKFEESGKLVEEAQSRLEKLVAEGDMQLFREADSLFTRIGRAHALLELEGIRLAPFAKPEPPQPMAAPKPEAPAKPAPEPATEGISFTKEVAPILVQRCGRCHVTGNRGDFSMSDYATLMKGPAIGIVVAPGSPEGSRLIEAIATGSMPPNGNGIPAAELKKLSVWVAAGAKYDGADTAMQLTSFATTAGQPARTPAAAIRQSTGKESVSFAKDVASILVQNCNGCHIDAMQTQGGLRMDTFAQLNRGGDSGPIVMPGKADMSLLLQRIKGEGGNRMPAGGRPPLSDEQIQMISTWIQEGATLDGKSPDQPLRVMTALAWARDATHEELMQRRTEMADHNWKMGSPEDEPTQIETDNFYVVGSVGPNTLKAVAEQAEAALSDAKGIVRRPEKQGQSTFKGRATIFAFPRRYDYSEFGRMIEGRSLPQDWTQHWRYDGLDAYAAIVVTPNDEDAQIKSRLIGPLTSLLVAETGDVPHWLSEGIGRAAFAKSAGRDNETVDTWNEELPVALAAFSKPEQLLTNKLPPNQADLISYAIGQFLIDRAYKPKFDKLINELAAGKDFGTAFVTAYGGQPKDVLTAFGRWYQANAGRRGR